MTEREEGGYTKAIHYRIQNPQAPFPDAPIVCVRPDSDGTTLAIARYKPNETNQDQIEDIIRIAVIQAEPKQQRWQNTSTPINPLIAIRTGSITGLITLATLFLLQQDQSIVPAASICSIIAALAASTVRIHIAHTSQRNAISEITRRVSSYSPKEHPINQMEVIHYHDQGLTVMGFPEGLGPAIEPSHSTRPD